MGARLCALGLLYLGVCSWVALCLAVFTFWPGVGGSGLY